ncbi:hypothetical protein BKA93DRAFT_752403 [Sparassis latifolia]
MFYSRISRARKNDGIAEDRPRKRVAQWLLVKTLVLSSDPWLRLKSGPPTGTQRWAVHSVLFLLKSFAVGIVLRSEDRNHSIPSVTRAKRLSAVRVPKDETAFRWLYLGVCGKDIYIDRKEFAHQKKGDFAFITSGLVIPAPLTLQVLSATVIELAKAEGFEVNVSAGVDAKIRSSRRGHRIQLKERG